MTEKQKTYIENNIDLIENEDWNKFFQNAPYGTGGIIYECGIDFMRNMEKIPQRCFLGSDLKIISIPDSVTSIGSFAFVHCKNLTSITIPDSVTDIANYAFQDCHNLTSINIPDSVTVIRSYSFAGCASLTNITIPNRVTSIDNFTFQDCVGLASIDIPESVTRIGRGAFDNCFRLSTISINNPETYFENNSIDTTNLTDIDYMGTCDEFRRYFNLNALNDDGGTIKINCSDGTLSIKYFPEVEEYRFTF